jgi:dethiobiotin synthetase
MTPGLFVTGTDTGVGKTTLSVAILRFAARAGQRVVPFKPAETGCDPDPKDAFRLWEAARLPIPRPSVCLYSFPLPAAPAAASAAHGIAITLDAIVDRARELRQAGDGLLVEGAGGLLAPYAPALTGADIAKALNFPVLVVARASLGTINHTALTVAELRRRGLALFGIILVQTTPQPGPEHASNAPLIEALTGVRPLGTFPYVSSPDADSLADALAATFPRPVLGDLMAALRSKGS